MKDGTYTQNDLKSFVSANLSVPSDNFGVNLVKDNSIYIFEDRCESANSGKLYVFARPTKYNPSTSPKTYSFGNNGVEIYKIETSKFDNFKSRLTKPMGSATSYKFEMKEAELIYSEKKPVVGQPKLGGDDINFNQLTARDYVCIQLRIPKTSHDWINDLIEQSKTN